MQYLSEIIDGNDDIVGNAALGVPIVKFTEYGEIVNKNIIKINEIYRYVSVLNYVIMPDHIHLILFVSDYEDDSRISPFSILTIEESEFLYDYLKSKRAKSN